MCDRATPKNDEKKAVNIFLLFENYEKLSQNEILKLAGYFNFTFTKTFLIYSKKVKSLLNKIFPTSDKENEQVIGQFAKKYDIRREQKLDSLQGLTISVYWKLLTLDS